MSQYRSLMLTASLFTLSLGCSPSASHSTLYGDDTVTNPAPGITHIVRRTDTPQIIHAVKIDLTQPQNKIHATRSADRKKITSKFADQYRCSVAINADFFSFENYQTIGLSVGEGERWEGTGDTESWGSLVVTKDNKVSIGAPAEVVPYTDEIFAAVGGKNHLIHDGKIVQAACASGDSFCNRHPRTAVGLSEDGNTLIMVVVDGRSEKSKGASLPELADIMLNLGSSRAINLDGGGSTAMYIRSEGGLINTPSDGRERVVANHLGVCEGPGAVAESGVMVGVIYTGNDTAKKVAGAKVTLSNGQSVVTNASGVYKFTGLKPGSYTVTVEKEGFATQTLTRQVAAEGDTWGSVNL